jgi:hypothetical protein
VSEVGVASIVFGVVMVCSRGPLLLAPAATLGWFERLIETDGRIRALGAVTLMLGTAMAWAGASERSGLAMILFVIGWAVIGSSTLALVLFPDAYRSIAEAVLPSDTDEDLIGWRLLGLLGVFVGVLMIYYGALAL